MTDNLKHITLPMVESITKRLQQELKALGYNVKVRGVKPYYYLITRFGWDCVEPIEVVPSIFARANFGADIGYVSQTYDNGSPKTIRFNVYLDCEFADEHRYTATILRLWGNVSPKGKIVWERLLCNEQEQDKLDWMRYGTYRDKAGE